MIAYKFRAGRGQKDVDGKDIFERDIELLSKDMIYVPTLEQLNDPAEALIDDSFFKTLCDVIAPLASTESVERVKESFLSFKDKIHSVGIYSLTKNLTNELMWSYYANGHKGYAIIFDTDVLSKSFASCNFTGMYEFDVRYSNTIPTFKISKVDGKKPVETLKDFLGVKSIAWEHEAEHRLVFDDGKQTLIIDYRAIKGFVFGLKMSDDDISFVMQRFAGRNMEYHKMEFKGKSYRLKSVDIPDQFPDSEPYYPNCVEYDLDQLIENDRFYGGVGYKYTALVRESLEKVRREPFVTSISHITVKENDKKVEILVWTNYHQPGVLRVRKDFKYEVRNGNLVRNE